MIKFSYYLSAFRNFFIAFFIALLGSARLAPSSGLKSQKSFIFLFPRKLNLYLQHLSRIYAIKYRYLASMNRYNINKQNIAILLCISFFPPPLVQIHCISAWGRCMYSVLYVAAFIVLLNASGTRHIVTDSKMFIHIEKWNCIILQKVL